MAEDDDKMVIMSREDFMKLFKCPLCDRPIAKATTISECQHKFCKKCIYKKFGKDEEDCCPVCNIYLGVSPLETLRTDYTVESIISTILQSSRFQCEPPVSQLPKTEPSAFKPPIVQLPKAESSADVAPIVQPLTARLPKAEPSGVEPPMGEPKKAEPSAVEPPVEPTEAENEKRGTDMEVAVPERINNISGSSLVVRTKKVTRKTPSTARGSITITRNVERVLSLPFDEQRSSEDRNIVLAVNPTTDPYPDQETEEGVKNFEGNADLYEPLSWLVEAANMNKNLKVSSEGYGEKSASKSEGQCSHKMMGNKPPKDVDGTEAGQAATSNPKKWKRNRKRPTASGSVSHQNLSNITEIVRQNDIPIWLSLVAAEEGDDLLPQISSTFLRIKNRNMPISSFHKYLMMKLDLESEDEIEIRCCNEPVYPEFKLKSVHKMWLESIPPTRKKAVVRVGSSVEDFVMVLTYRRKVSSHEKESDK